MMEDFRACLYSYGYREIDQLADLLKLWADQKITELARNYFGDLHTHGFNPSSGCVWLEDSDYNCLMENGDKLDLFITTPYNGIEGFLEDILNENNPEDLRKEDREYLIDLLDNSDVKNDIWNDYIVGEDKNLKENRE